MEKIILVRVNNFDEALKGNLKNYFNKNDKIAVKLHMGEKGNTHYLKPELIKKTIDVLKELDLNPFLFDSPVCYHGERNTADGYTNTAKEHGFSEKTMGCPVLISDDSLKKKSNYMDYRVCKDLINADGVLAVSHLKGHICAGFGGAIKNLGMGALSKKTKAEIHKGSEPEYIGGCTLCRECEKACPTDNIRYDNGRPYFDKNWCCQCSNCVYACKFNALKTKVNFFDKLLAGGAVTALKNFKKAFFVNFLVDITKYCDCMRNSEPVISENIGVLMGKSMALIDLASFDLIKKKNNGDIFLKHNKKSPLFHINETFKLTGEDKSYSLEEV